MRNIEDPHDPLECNCASVESASSCQRLRLRNVKHAHSARTVNCAASSCTPFLLSLCLCLALSATITMAAPQTSCILCNKEDLRAREPTISGSYEEFIFDHQVSREEAIQALRKYNESKTCIRLSLASTRSLCAHSLSLFFHSHSCCSTRQAELLQWDGVFAHSAEILFGAEIRERSLLV